MKISAFWSSSVGREDYRNLHLIASEEEVSADSYLFPVIGPLSLKFFLTTFNASDEPYSFILANAKRWVAVDCDMI